MTSTHNIFSKKTQNYTQPHTKTQLKHPKFLDRPTNQALLAQAFPRKYFKPLRGFLKRNSFPEWWASTRSACWFREKRQLEVLIQQRFMTSTPSKLRTSQTELSVVPSLSLSKPLKLDREICKKFQSKFERQIPKLLFFREVTVNDGRVPTSAQAQGQHTYAISFTPRDAQNHTVELRFNGQDVPGSPFICKVKVTAKNFMTIKNFPLI